MNFKNWVVFLFILMVLVVPVSSKVIIIENRILSASGSGAAAAVAGSNETLIDASECGNVSCDTFIEVMT